MKSNAPGSGQLQAAACAFGVPPQHSDDLRSDRNLICAPQNHPQIQILA
jgi:hypothetical protein